MKVQFDPNRATHIALLQFLTTTFPNQHQVRMITYGNRTQHLFRNGEYLMTVNWNLV